MRRTLVIMFICALLCLLLLCLALFAHLSLGEEAFHDTSVTALQSTSRVLCQSHHLISRPPLDTLSGLSTKIKITLILLSSLLLLSLVTIGVLSYMIAHKSELVVSPNNVDEETLRAKVQTEIKEAGDRERRLQEEENGQRTTRIIVPSVIIFAFFLFIVANWCANNDIQTITYWTTCLSVFIMAFLLLGGLFKAETGTVLVGLLTTIGVVMIQRAYFAPSMLQRIAIIVMTCLLIICATLIGLFLPYSL